MELCFVLDIARVVRHSANDDNRKITVLDRSWFRSNASLDLCSIELRKAHRCPIALLDTLYCFPKHLHRLYLFVYFHCRDLNSVANVSFSCETSSCHDCSLSFDLEAVINRKEEVFLRTSVSIGDFNLLHDLGD